MARKKLRVQWYITEPSIAWIEKMAAVTGVKTSVVVDRMIRHTVGELPENEAEAFEKIFMGPMGESVAEDLDWSVGR